MPDDWTMILVRFGEIGIKGPQTRARFLRRLQANVEDQLAARSVEAAVRQDRGRLYVTAKDVEGALEAIARTFGVVSASPAERVEPTKEAILAGVAATAPRVLRSGMSFAVRARRTGDQPFTSMDLAREAGDAVWRAVPGLRVDLTNPDVEVHVEVRPDHAYVFTRVIEGPGGLPIGTQGRVLVHAASPRDAAAAWLLLRRGCTVDVLLPPDADAATRAAVERLRAWAPRLKVQEDALPRADALRSWAHRRRATAVGVGEGLGGAAADRALDAAVGLPVLRPLVGYAGDRLAELGRRIGFPLPEEAAA